MSRALIERKLGSNLATAFFKVALLTYLGVSQLSVGLYGKREGGMCYS